MSKPVLGLLLGAVLGLVDGASAWFYPYPEVRAQIAGIIVGSTFKGLLTGLVAGFAATKLRSVPIGIGIGLVLGLGLSYLVAAMPGESGQHYWAEIMIPGTLLGAVVGFATQRYGRGARVAS